MSELSQATYDAVRDSTLRSACVLLPMICEKPPSAMLDVGAGELLWGKAASLIWPDTAYHSIDLPSWDAERGDELPMRGIVTDQRQEGDELHLSVEPELQRWPLVLCLEMVEHVTPEAGRHVIRELCRVAERVAFSAAIPGQGGDGHVNEQWPAYWHGLFAAEGWLLTDPLRNVIWMHHAIEPWYRQNLLIARPRRHESDEGKPAPRPLVDPVTWAHHRGVDAP